MQNMVLEAPAARGPAVNARPPASVVAESVLWLGARRPPWDQLTSDAALPLTVATLPATTADAVANWLVGHQPLAVIAELDWCIKVGEHDLRRLRRLTRSAEWLLRWEEPSSRWLSLLLAAQIRGAVLHCDSPSLVSKAIHSVRHGELWLPRRVLQWLHTDLLGRWQDEQISISPVLTQREAEALNLLRLGLTNREIAQRINVSLNTVKNTSARRSISAGSATAASLPASGRFDA